MIRHLAETTNMAANNGRLLKRLSIAAYWVCWGLVFSVYSILMIIFDNLRYFGDINRILCYVPVAAAFTAITVLIGMTGNFKSKWLYIPITGAIFPLYVFLIWNVCANMIECAQHNASWRAYWGDTRPEGLCYFNFSESLGNFFYSNSETEALTACLWGMLCSEIGILIGSYIRNIRADKAIGKKERYENNNAPIGENAHI